MKLLGDRSKGYHHQKEIEGHKRPSEESGEHCRAMTIGYFVQFIHAIDSDVSLNEQENAAILIVAAAAFKRFVKITGDSKPNGALSRKSEVRQREPERQLINMLIKKTADIQSSEITSQKTYL